MPVINKYPIATDLPYGQILGNSILQSGEADVNGNFNWVDANEIFVTGGFYLKDVIFNSESTSNILFKSLIYAQKENPIVNVFPTVNSIENYGSKLRTLDIQGGLVNVPGTFYWKNPNQIPNVGINEYDIIFVPENTGRYEILGKDPEFGFQGFVNSGTLYKYFGVYDWDTTSTAGGVTDFTSIQGLNPPNPGVDGHYVVRATGINKGIVVSVSSGNSIYKNFINTQRTTFPNSPTINYSTTLNNQKRLLSPRSDDNVYAYLSDPIEITTLKLSVNVLNKKTPNVFLNPIATNINAGQTLNSSQLLSGIVAEDIIYSNIITGSGSLANPSPNLESLRIINDRRNNINQYEYFNAFNLPFKTGLGSISNINPTLVDFSDVVLAYSWPNYGWGHPLAVPGYQQDIFVFQNTSNNSIILEFEGNADLWLYLITGWNGTLREDNLIGQCCSPFAGVRKTIPPNSINAITLKNDTGPTSANFIAKRVGGEPAYIDFNWPALTFPVGQNVNIYQTGIFVFRNTGEYPIDLYFSGIADDQMYLITGWNGILLENDGFDISQNAGTDNFPLTKRTIPANSINALTLKNGPPGGPTYGIVRIFGEELLNGYVLGTFAWQNPSSVPVGGTNSYPVTFTPLDTNNYNSITFNVSLTVNKSNPTITTMPTVNPITTYGPNLNSLNLNGGAASVPGTFVWTSPNIVPTFGTTSQSVTFIPSDTDSFNQVTFNINVIVQNRATPSIISNPTASTITYLQTLNNSNLQGGSASVEGTFAWTSPSFAPNAGTNNYNVLFTPSNSNYLSLSIPISLTVNKANPVITFPTIPKLNKSLQSEYTLNATSNSNESQITYSSSNLNVATVAGIKLNLISFGFSTITASQIETANFNSASSTRELEIISSRLPKILSISNLPNGLVYNSINRTLQGIIEDEGNYHVKFYLEEDGIICEKTLNLMVSNKNKRYLYSVNNPINIGFIKYNAQERIGQEDVIESYDHPIYGKILRHSKLGTIYGYIKDIKEEIEVYNHPTYGPILRNTRNGTIYGYTGDSNNMPNYINNLYGI